MITIRMRKLGGVTGHNLIGRLRRARVVEMSHPRRERQSGVFYGGCDEMKNKKK